MKGERLLLQSLALFLITATWHGAEPPRIWLDLDETLGLAMQGRHWHKYGPFHYVKLDPEAADIIRSQFGESHISLIESRLGVLGLLASTPDDLAFLENTIVTAGQDMSQPAIPYPEVGDEWLRSYFIVDYGIETIAELALRGDESAKSLLIQMTNPDYWNTRNIRVESMFDDVPYQGVFKAIDLLYRYFPDSHKEPLDALVDGLASSGIILSTEQMRKMYWIGEPRSGDRRCLRLRPSNRLTDDTSREMLRRATLRFMDENYQLRDEPLDWDLVPNG